MSPRPGSLSARLQTRTSVLVVEDEADIADFLGAYFRASGLDLVHVNPRRPDDVVEAVRAHGTACVLLDLNLVGFSGLEVLARFRDDDRLAEIPVVVVSAYTAEAPRCMELGASDFVAKPFNVSDLYDKVAAIVGEPRAKRPAVPTPAGETSDLPAVSAEELEDRIGRALLRASRDDKPLSLALVRVAPAEVSRFSTALPDGSVVGRTAPNEIAVLLPGTACAQAEQTLDDALGGLQPRVSVRAGVACAPEHAATTDELYMAADAALADACDSGRSVATAK